MQRTISLGKRGISRQLKTDLTGYAFIAPNVLGFTLFTLVPMIISLIISFTDWDYTQGFGNWIFNGGANYVEVWADKWFVDSLVNTIVFAAGVVPVTIFLALVLAVVIDKFCYAKLPIRLAMFMPYISNVVAVAIVWVMMYSPWGPFTQMVKMLGVENPPQWLGDHHWALPAIMLMTVWSGVGYAMMIYTSSITALPKDIYEAADLDGVNGIQRFFYITLPQLKPTTFFLTVTGIISSFKVFGSINVMTHGGPGSSTYTLVYYIYKSAFTYYEMGYASAVAMVLFAILLCVTLYQWHHNKNND